MHVYFSSNLRTIEANPSRLATARHEEAAYQIWSACLHTLQRYKGDTQNITK